MTEERGGSVDETAAFWTFDAVEARLIEAVRCWRRMPDRERGWQKVRAWWPEVRRFPEWVNIGGEICEREADPAPRRRAVTRGEIAAMEEATGWLSFVDDEGQRRALAGGLSERARGARQVGWTALRAALGDPTSPAGLQRRYERAIGFIAAVLNARSGMKIGADGRRMRVPRGVSAVVERLKMAENCGRRLSRG